MKKQLPAPGACLLPHIKKIARWSLWSAIGLMALFIGLHLLLPHILNSQAIKNKIIAAARQAISAQVDFTSLHFNLLPMPSVEVVDGKLELPRRLNFQAQAITIYPDILRLLRGQIRIHAAEIQTPEVEIHLGTPPTASAVPVASPAPNPAEVLRAVLAQLPPDIRLTIHHGQLRIMRKNKSMVHVEAIEAEAVNGAQTVIFDLRGHANLFDQLGTHLTIDKDSLNLEGRLDLTGINSKQWKALFFHGTAPGLPATVADLHLTFKSQGLSALQGRFEANAPTVALRHEGSAVEFKAIALEGGLDWQNQRLEVNLTRLQVAAPRLALGGTLSWRFNDPAPPDALRLSIQAQEADVTAWRSAMLTLWPDLNLGGLWDIIRGGSASAVTVESSGASWQEVGRLANLKIAGSAAGAHIVVPGIKLDLTQASGAWQLTDGILKVQQAAAEVAGSKANNGNLALGLLSPSLPIDLKVDLDADLAQLPPLLKKMLPSPEIQAELDHIKQMRGTAKGQLVLSGSVQALQVAVSAREIRLRAEYDRLPAAVEVSGGQLRYEGDQLHLKEIYARMGDLSLAKFSGRIGLKAPLSVQLIGQGTIGANILQWAHQRFPWPDEFQPQAPISVSSIDATWQADGPLAVNGTFSFANQLQAAIRLSAGPTYLEISRLILSDDTSNARIRVRHDQTPDDAWQVEFNGELARSTLAKIWRSQTPQAGWMRGQISVSLAMAQPGRTKVQGRLEVRDLNIPLKTLGPLQIDHLDIHSGQGSLAINALDLTWQQQRLALKGDLLFLRKALQMNLTLSADELDIGSVEKKINEIKAAQKKKGSSSGNASTQSQKPSLTGQIKVMLGSLIYGTHRWEPMQATILLSPDQITVKVTDANTCGIATLGSLRWTPQQIWLDLIPKAVNQPLQLTGGCLSNEQSTERIEGTYSINGKITSSGTNGQQILEQMQGRIQFSAVNGRIFNAGDVGLITNILSYLRINKLVQGELPDLKERDFKFNSIHIDLTIGEGRISLERADVLSPTLNLVAYGTFDYMRNDANLTVLASPLTSVDTVVRHLPILGKILQGTLIAIPIGVRGPINHPTVIPLSPKAVGDRLIGILERTLKAPLQLIEPVTGAEDEKKSSP